MLISTILSVALAALPQEAPGAAQQPAAQAQAQATSAEPTAITLQQALKIALSENTAIKVADKEIERAEYSKKGTYASLFPNIDMSAAYQRTIKKQVMYMDGDSFDFGSMIGDALMGYLMPLYAQHPGVTPPTPSPKEEDESSSDGFAVGRWNTWSAGVNASLPLINAQLWESLKVSGTDVELAVEKARSSRLETVNQVKQAYFGVLLAKAARDVYASVYENALENLAQTEKKYKVQKASELDLTRAKTTLANAVPNMYDSESKVVIALWQLKAVMGVDLELNIDTAGELMDYAGTMFHDLHVHDNADLSGNSSLKQLALQAEELASAVKIQQRACLPSLALGFSYTYSAMTNDFNFSEYQWTPYSYVGLSLNIPIFSGGKRASQIRQAKAQAYELDLQKTNAERQLKIAVRQYLAMMDNAMKSYDSSVSAAETAQKAYDIAQKSYNVGRSTLTDLNDAQLMLVQARLGVAQNVYSFVTAKANLENTLGADYTTE